MKKMLLLIIIIFFCGCSNTNFKFNETSEFRYIEDNVKDIDKFIVITETLLGKHCYEVNKEIGYDVLKSYKIEKEVDIYVTDSDMYYKISFNNGIFKTFAFEGRYLVYNGKKYRLNSTLNEFVLSKQNEIEC